MSQSVLQILKQKITDRSAVVAVIGLGYVGLPLVVVFGNAGYKVIGIDVDPQKVEKLNLGESYIQDVPTADIKRLVDAGLLHATTDFSALKNAEAVSICVPTPLRKTGDPDLSFIVNATDELAKYVHSGMVIILESTTYPGTTRELILPRLSDCCDLKVGEDFFLAFSPERVDPGRQDWTTYNTPKVVGGITTACCDVAATWYSQALKTVVQVSSAEVAEMTKLLENTFRMINIGLVNELALMCDRLGVDVWEVIDAASTKPFGFMRFTPGPGLGGHCIPIDPLYLSWKLKALNYNARFIELASEINTNMPRFVVQKTQDALNDQGKAVKGSRILVLGAAYKPDIDDLRESPALDVMGLLIAKGAQVSYHDPFIPIIRHDALNLKSVVDVSEAISAADCVVIITDHQTYDYKKLVKQAKLVIDTRNATGKVGKNLKNVVRL
jgi:UDP-N-acetyl-D-glucosamine dehydrogenase